MVRLTPMSEEEFRAFEAASIPNYAEENVRSGRWTPAEAPARSAAEFRRLLPEGRSTVDHHFFVARDDGGQRVGEVWYARLRAEGPPTVFIYWIGVDAPFRRRGHATHMLRLVEEAARALGAAQVGLHVFGDNAGAIETYRRAGFTAVDLVMSKPVGPAP